jgi:hypothetical protein
MQNTELQNTVHSRQRAGRPAGRRAGASQARRKQPRRKAARQPAKAAIATASLSKAHDASFVVILLVLQIMILNKRRGDEEDLEERKFELPVVPSTQQESSLLENLGYETMLVYPTIPTKVKSQMRILSCNNASLLTAHHAILSVSFRPGTRLSLVDLPRLF